ncbi:putative F420-0 ABC transporter substrate-binding protein [Protaetiibacter larvae]|uniref:Putative F420-0 ABC transporter substrate-binding protein n=1 Tax=Protaetiibacter larvae TaxID=2592654 RepID=A0A5C1Y9L6_9MICO|nr:putative F420-0 ABC transporter substrate-binding protein [Protaetiibacter larvae]QEO10614.1 putative F420-0 ABC transporter substrate-binding protein [Protaetiibacter larvae]
MARRLAPLALIPLLLLAGCAPSPAAPTTPSPSAETASYPLTFSNCGFEVTIPEPPKRVVTIKSTSTEMMLALGVGNRIVGTAYQDGPVPEQWADAGDAIPSIAEKLPSEEVTLEQTPDLVYAGWESAFTPDTAGDRAELASLGVASYVQPAACQSAEQPAKLTFDEVFREIEQAGDIFGVPEAAAELVAAQKEQLAAIQPATGSPTALWWSSGVDTPYVGAGIGAPELLLETAGLTNIAADVRSTWAPLGWEAIIAANPDVLVLVDSSWNSAQKKMDYLASNPATAALPAVQHKRYVIIPFASSEAGVRSVEAAASIAAQLQGLDLP